MRHAPTILLNVLRPTTLCAAMTFAMHAGAAPQDAKPTTPPTTPPAATPAEPTTKKDLPPAQDILKKTVTALGGRRAIDKIESSTTVAEMESPMGMVAIETHWAKPDRMLIKQSMSGMEFSLGYDGKVGWMMNPMTQAYELLDDDQLDQMRGQAAIHMTLANLEKEFKWIETVDVAEFDGRECYKLRVRREAQDAAKEETKEIVDEEKTHLYLDSKSFLFAGMESESEGPMGPMTTVITFRDWKDHDGVKMFRSMIAQQMGMELAVTYTSIELNKVDEAVFELPDEVLQMAKERATSRPASQPDETPAPAPAPADDDDK
jgi:hypothetical protein